MILGLERSPGEGKGYPLQYSGLENSMDCIVLGVTKSRTRLTLTDFYFHFQIFLTKKKYALECVFTHFFFQARCLITESTFHTSVLKFVKSTLVVNAGSLAYFIKGGDIFLKKDR